MTVHYHCTLEKQKREILAPGVWEKVSQMDGLRPPSLAAPSTCKTLPLLLWEVQQEY